MDESLMDDNRLRRLASREKIPLGTLEKDYAITNLLSIISAFPKLDSMVFKGGTALKKIHFKNFRFSEDLDFTCMQDVSEEFVDFINSKMKALDVKFTEITDDERKPNSFKFKVKYAQFNGVTAGVRVDLSLREDVMLDAITKPVLHFYDTIPNVFEIPTMDLEEIMAEKIRAIVYTRHPRHLHDVWYLDSNGIKLNPKMIRDKIKKAYGAEFDLQKFKDGISEKESDWKNDLQPLLPDSPPSFESVSKRVLEIVTNAMK